MRHLDKDPARIGIVKVMHAPCQKQIFSHLVSLNWWISEHIYCEIAELLNQQGYHPGEAERHGRHDARFTPLRVGYLVTTLADSISGKTDSVVGAATGRR
ncbi:hypothetical protein I6F26_33670 [Ensifer sp. IC3342]|nr:hypothetical protein [Ensifer sp. BRP08]MCA1451361.1 hypothetical protein [Ensifer sp. IC3342]